LKKEKNQVSGLSYFEMEGFCRGIYFRRIYRSRNGTIRVFYRTDSGRIFGRMG
jgi:hypothetical protein